jgi:flagellar hook protein FlgE
VQVTLKDDKNTVFVRGQVLLQNFANPDALVKEGNNLYSGLSAAGPLGTAAAPASVAPNTNGTGEIVSGQFEGSNVDLTAQMVDLITTQRAFQANSKIITTSDEFLQEVVNLKR